MFFSADIYFYFSVYLIFLVIYVSAYWFVFDIIFIILFFVEITMFLYIIHDMLYIFHFCFIKHFLFMFYMTFLSFFFCVNGDRVYSLEECQTVCVVDLCVNHLIFFLLRFMFAVNLTPKSFDHGTQATLHNICIYSCI